MKIHKLSLIGIIMIVLAGCASNQKTKSKYERYVVKLVYRNECVRLGADGLADEEFDAVIKGQSVIPGDVILIEKDQDLSIIKSIVEKQDMSKKYLVPVIKINDPTGVDWEKSKYLYDVYITSEWQNLHFGEYILKFDRKNDCVINVDSSVNYLWEIPTNSQFYAIFDSSCCTKETAIIDNNENSVVERFTVTPTMFLFRD